MERVLFLTSNEEKFRWAKKKLASYDITLVRNDFGLPEIQDVETERVAVEKAKYAQDFVQQPFFVADTGFEIDVLDRFPGALLKPVMKTIGAEGLCALMRGKTNRDCNFKSVLVHSDADGDLHTFACNDTGTVAEEPTGTKRDQWGDIMRLHRPDGFDTTLAAMSEEAFEDYEERMESEEHYVKFAQWFTGRDAE